jgi:hypothetical protein
MTQDTKAGPMREPSAPIKSVGGEWRSRTDAFAPSIARQSGRADNRKTLSL